MRLCVFALASLLLTISPALSEGEKDWIITAASGRTEVLGPGGWAPAAAGDMIRSGDSLRTQADGELQLKLGRHWIHLSSQSQIEIRGDASSYAITIVESRGNVGYEVNGDAGQEFIIRTPQLTAAARTGVFGIGATDRVSVVGVRSGAVRAEDKDRLSQTDLHAGETARATLGARLVKRPVSGKDIADDPTSPVNLAMRAAAAAAEIAPVVPPVEVNSEKGVNNDKANTAKKVALTAGSVAPVDLRGAIAARSPDASGTLSGAGTLAAVAKQLPGGANPEAPNPANTAEFAAANVSAVISAGGKTHVDAGELAAVAAGVAGARAKIDISAASAAMGAMGTAIAQQAAADAPSDPQDDEKSKDAPARKAKPATADKKGQIGAKDGLSAPDPKAEKTKKKDAKDDEAEPDETKPDEAATLEKAPELAPTQAAFAGQLLPELFELDDTGKFIIGLAVVMLTLGFGAILNAITGEMGFGVGGNGLLALLGTLLGAEIRDLVFSGDFWIEYDPYVSLAVILSGAIGILFGATYLKAQLMSDPEERKPVRTITTISADRLAKIRVE